MKTVYICEVCGRMYSSQEECSKCENDCNSKVPAIQIELCWTMNDYGFATLPFRVHRKCINEAIQVCGFYGNYPKFRTECFNTPEEILAAKNRLVVAAIDWTDEYKDMLNSLAGELENDGGNGNG